jgi:hypothetical protein
MSRIYTVRNKNSGALVRYVRAHNLNSAVRAVADEQFTAKASTTEELYQAAIAEKFEVLDALKPTQTDIDDDEPAPVPPALANSRMQVA